MDAVHSITNKCVAQGLEASQGDAVNLPWLAFSGPLGLVRMQPRSCVGRAPYGHEARPLCSGDRLMMRDQGIRGGVK